MEVSTGMWDRTGLLYVFAMVFFCTNLRAGTIYFENPSIGNIDQHFAVTPAWIPPGTFELIQWTRNPNSSSGDVAAAWDVGLFTGFTPPDPVDVYQRGVTRQGVRSTAVQAAGNTVGFLIDSESLRTATTGSGTLFPIVAQYSFPSAQQFRPFAQPGNTLVYAMQAQLPYGVGEGNCGAGGSACAYATMYFNIQDATTGLEFWYGAALYDTRGTPNGLGYLGESIFYDNSTREAIVAGVVNLGAAHGARFTTAFATSQGFQSQIWTGYKPFQFAISAANLENAVGKIKAHYPAQYGRLSSNPANYRVFQINFNPEVAYFGGSASVGVAFNNIRISVQDGNDCYNTYNGVDNALGLTNGDIRFLCHNRQWYDCGFERTVNWSIHASQNERIGNYSCSLFNATWQN